MTEAKFNPEHFGVINGDEVAERLKGILKASDVKMLITGAHVSALFPDGSVAYCQPLHMDTEDLP